MFHILLKRLNASLLPPSLDSIWPEDVGEDRGRLTKADDLANVIDGADPLINDGLPAHGLAECGNEHPGRYEINKGQHFILKIKSYPQLSLTRIPKMGG